MILLNGHSLTVKDVFRPERMALNLSERQSTATVTVGPEAPVIAVDNWLQDDTEPGKGIVWRVKMIEDQVEKGTRTIQLEHVISTLRDRVLFGEIKTQNIPGGTANGVSAENAVKFVLSKQGDWVLGDFAYGSVSNPYSFNGDDLFSAMETISSSLKDCIWEYDLGRYPFRLHIRKLSDAVGSEMRMSRNITTLKTTIDRSRMYTRMYPIGKNNLHIAGEYVSRNENLYGVVCKVETDQSLNTEAKLRAWALERLERHCEPLVTVTVSGLDLSEATGEELDRLVIGRECRIPLPEFGGAVITERITKLSWSDKTGEPEKVTVTLANELMDVATILKQQSAGGGRGARNDALEKEEDHAWFVDTTEKVAMVAEGIAGKDADGKPNWSRVSQLTVDGNGIDARVTVAEGEMVTAQARITQTENAITAEVTRATGAEGTLGSQITQTADAITAEVTRATAAENTMSGRITVNSNKVSVVVEEKDGQNVVKAASIVAGINDQTGSYVKISASTINLSGYVTASELAATNATIDNLMSGSSTATHLRCGSFSCNSAQFTLGTNVVWKSTITDGDGNTVNVMKWG